MEGNIAKVLSHIDIASGVDCGPTGGLADGEEAAHALDPTRRADVAPRALCATQRRTGQIHPMVGLRIIARAGGGGMTPRFQSRFNCKNLSSKCASLRITCNRHRHNRVRWSGPQLPLFSKDRITTFERDLIADPAYAPRDCLTKRHSSLHSELASFGSCSEPTGQSSCVILVCGKS